MRDQNHKPRGAADKESLGFAGDRRLTPIVVVVRPPAAARAEPLPVWNSRLAARLKAAAKCGNAHEIARQTEANAETVRRYLRDGNPSIRFLARFCQVYDVSADWILNGKHWTEGKPAGGRSALPEAKVRVTLGLSKGRVRVLKDDAQAGPQFPPSGPSRAKRMVRGAKGQHEAGSARSHGTLGGMAASPRPPF